MSVNPKCFVHGGRERDIHGHFQHFRRKYAEARVLISGVEHYADILIDKIPARHRKENLIGRPFAVSKSGRIHLCACTWTKAEIEKINRWAKRMAKKFKPLPVDQ